MTPLPIDAIKNDFIGHLSSGDLVVEAETGSGKSTRLPIWATTQGRVLVIEPRRIACLSLAEFLSKQQCSDMGDKVGYAIKLKTKFSENTEIIFATPGVALRWFSSHKLDEFDVVLVDEFHERRWDIDLLVALLLEAKQHKLVITSATIEGEKLADYIGAKRLVAKGRQYNVSVSHHCRDPHSLPESKNVVQHTVSVAKAYYLKTKGDVLIFMPGRSEIAQCVHALSTLRDVEIVALHASVSDGERSKALRPLNKKKIVVATNVAETSLTIPNITLVIDSGLERRTLQRNGRTVLSLRHISKASATQRAGRAGRVMDGDCIRLYGQYASLEQITPPELLREELTEAMLSAACSGYSLSGLSFLNSPPEKSLNQARKTLQKMGAIDELGLVTDHGALLYPLPIDTMYADLLTRMSIKSTKEAMIDLSAALSISTSLYQLPTDDRQLEALAQWEPYGCDAAILLKLIRGDVPDFLHVDMTGLKEAKGLAQQMRTAFELPNLEVASRYERKELLAEIIELHPELAYVRRKKRRETLGNGVLEMVPARISRFSDNEEAAIILDQYSLPGRGIKQTINLASVMLPIPLNLIVESNLGEWQQENTVIKEGEIYSQLSLVYAGRSIVSRLVKPEGDLLLKPLIDAVTNQTVLPGLANKMKEQIEHWCLYVSLGLAGKPPKYPTISFETWFNDQLVDLGILAVEELELFSQDDFVFDGIPYWEYDDFALTYPLRLNLGDLKLKVEYVVNRKLIYIVYESGLRKSDPKRWELPRWKNWRIQYKKASRTINIK